jgi:plasmid stabilization system protein ParE
MKVRYVLAPQAAADLAEIWRYIRNQSSAEMADHVIVYRPETTPLQVVSILHGRRDVEQLPKDRL